jgi:hypothetical protein
MFMPAAMATPLNSFVQVGVDVEVQVANGDWRFSLAEPSCLATA